MLCPLLFPVTTLQPSASEEPVLPRVIRCPRHLLAHSPDKLPFSASSFPLECLREVSSARERICGFQSAKAGRSARQRPLTLTPLFHQWGMEDLVVDEKMRITSQLQVKIDVNLNFQPVDGLQVLPALPEGRKEIKRNPNREKCVCREASIITVETPQKRFFRSH